MTPRDWIIETIRWMFWMTSAGAFVGAWYAVAVVRAAERDVALAALVDEGLRREMRRALTQARVLGVCLACIAFICFNSGLQGYWAPGRRLIALIVFFVLSWLLVWVARHLAHGIRHEAEERALAAELQGRRSGDELS